jgi:hypothetical protein
MNKKPLYLQIYKILRAVTPLKKDCGDLCDKACCHGVDQETGMYLYPGEEELQYFNTSLKIKPMRFFGGSGLLAICSGECERDRRPLACRVFPLIPYYTPKDILTIKMDPRAHSLCPLARTLTRSELNSEFTIKVREAFRLLNVDPDIKEFMIRQSCALDEFREIESRFR